MPSNIHI
jgi:hypothetical protein